VPKIGENSVGAGFFRTVPQTLLPPPSVVIESVPEARLKAIEIANALLYEGYDEGKAIRIAIARAKDWAGDRGW
jgi:hypothetical protein